MKLFESRKNRLLFLDLALSAVVYFTTKYAAPAIAEDVLYLIGLMQVPFGVTIHGIAKEDAAAKSIGAHAAQFGKVGKAVAVVFLLALIPSMAASAQDCVELTGRSGHLIFPAGVWQGEADTVRAFGPQGDCVGEGEISAAPSALTMWGYDDLAHEYQGKGGLRAGDPIALASSGGSLAVRLRADQPYLSKRLVWSDDMIAVASMVAPADSLFSALDSLEAAVAALAQDRAALAQQVANQADQIVGLQQQAAALMGERDAALAMLAPVEAERDSLASEVQALTQERDALAQERAELAIRVDEQATTIESATTRIRAITRGL